MISFMAASITATAAINQMVNGTLVGIAIFGAVKYKKVPSIKIK